MTEITYKNNWERHEYYAGKEQLKTIMRVELVKEFRSYTVNVHQKPDYRSYSDWGHESHVSSTQFYVTLTDEMFGITTEIPLNSLIAKGFKINLLEGE
jgi:hypothetical protein